MTSPATSHGARFAGAVALVTGASRGIGLAIAQRIVDEGGRVVLTARNAEGLAEAVASLGGAEFATAIAGKGDDPDHQAEVFATIDREHGRLDVLVNNTGINPAYGPLAKLDDGVARKIMDVNVLSALEWTKQALAAGLGRDSLGAIVNIASVAGLGPAPGIAYYGVSKSALIGLTVQLAAELSPRVRVNAIAPAVVKTRFAAALYESDEEGAASRYPLKRLGEPDDIAAAAAFLASPDASWITGQTIVIDGGISLQRRASRPHEPCSATPCRPQVLHVPERLRAVAAEVLPVALACQPAAVVNQEAARAGELVVLLRKHPHGELLTRHAGEISAREFQGLVQLGLVDVDRTGLRFGASGLQLLERVLVQLVGLTTTWGVVIGCHLSFNSLARLARDPAAARSHLWRRRQF